MSIHIPKLKIKGKKGFKNMITLLGLLSVLNFQSCDNKPKSRERIEVKKNDLAKKIDGTYVYNIHEKINDMKEYDKVKFPKKLQNGSVSYFYTFGNHEINIIFKKNKDIIKIKDIIHNDNKNLGRKEKDKIKVLKNKYNNKKIIVNHPSVFKTSINEILNFLIGEKRKTAKKETLDLAYYYINGGDSENDWIKREEKNLKNIYNDYKNIIRPRELKNKLKQALSSPEFKWNEKRKSVDFKYKTEPIGNPSDYKEEGVESKVIKMSLRQHGNGIEIFVMIDINERNKLISFPHLEKIYYFTGSVNLLTLPEEVVRLQREGFKNKKGVIVSQSNDKKVLEKLERNIEGALLILYHKLGMEIK